MLYNKACTLPPYVSTPIVSKELFLDRNSQHIEYFSRYYMADLEDRILRQNVPGRWASLSGENDDKRLENDDDDESNDECVLL